MLVIIFLSNEEVPILLTRSEEEAQKIALSKAGKMIEEMVDYVVILVMYSSSIILLVP